MIDTTYKRLKAEYLARFGRPWEHLSAFGSEQSSEVCETMMRNGPLVRAFKPATPHEEEILANVAIIQGKLRQ